MGQGISFLTMNITPEQALNNLYIAARKSPLTADEHDIVRKSAEVLLESLKGKETAKDDGKVVEMPQGS